MPNEKSIEATDFQDVIMAIIQGREPKSHFYTIYEVADIYFAKIKQFLSLLDNGKTTCYEHSKNGNMYRWQKKGTDIFAFQSLTDAGVETFEVNSNMVLNKIFEHVPFIELIGQEQSMKLEFDKQS